MAVTANPTIVYREEKGPLGDEAYNLTPQEVDGNFKQLDTRLTSVEQAEPGTGVTVVQGTGTSTTAVMSQNAVTQAIATIGSGSLPWFNVLDFGAVADGSTDNYQAFMDTYDAIPASGGVFYIPAGISFYGLSQAVVIQKSYITFLGDNAGLRSHVYDNGIGGGSQIVYGGSTGEAFRIIGGMISTQRRTALTFRNIGIWGTSKENGVVAGIRAVLNQEGDTLCTDYLKIENCAITKIGIALDLDACDVPMVSGNWLCENGISVRIGNSVHPIVNNANIIADNTSDGVHIYNTRSGIIDHNIFARNQIQIKMNNAINLNINNNNIHDANNAVAIWLENGSNDNTIQLNQIRTTVGGIRVIASNENLIQNNYIKIAGAEDINIVSGNDNAVVDNFSKNLVSDTGVNTIIRYLNASFSGGNTGGNDTTPNSNAQNYINALTAAGADVSSPLQTYLHVLYNYLESNGLYTKIDCFWLPVWGLAAANRINAKMDTAYNLTFAGNWNHGTSGIVSDGTSAYADTHFVAANSSVFSDFSLGIYRRNNDVPVSGGHVDFGAIDGNKETYVYTPQGGIGQAADFFINLFDNQTPNSVLGVGAKNGLWLNTRNSASKLAYSKGTEIASFAAGNNGLNTSSFYLGAANNGGAVSNFAAGEYSFAYIGKHLNAANVSSLNLAIEQFMDNMGIGVQ